MGYLFSLTLGKLLDGKFDVSVQLLGEPLQLQFLGLLGGVAVVLFGRYLRGIDCRLRASESYPHLLVLPAWSIGEVDGENLCTLLVGESEQSLYLIELVHILTLVKENLAVAVVDDGTLDDRGRYDILYLLSDHNGFAEELADSLE